VNEDGNETSGVPSVQLQAPLGTYLGWNTFRSGVFAGYGCGFQGGWIPFAKTKAERISHHDPRLSLEERYGTHEGYVSSVRKAADHAVKDRFVLPDDAARYVREAQASKVLEGTQPAGGQPALSEAQRYPADYDGIVAGEPQGPRVNRAPPPSAPGPR
jgi:hypothetical protein